MSKENILLGEFSDPAETGATSVQTYPLQETIRGLSDTVLDAIESTVVCAQKEKLAEVVSEEDAVYALHVLHEEQYAFSDMQEICRQFSKNRRVMDTAIRLRSVLISLADVSLRNDEAFMTPLVELYEYNVLVFSPKFIYSKPMIDLAEEVRKAKTAREQPTAYAGSALQ
jgi:hypothetical protein